MITRPDIILEIHEQYLEAGADIIETNTFNANRISMADYSLQDQVYRINREAAAIANKAAKKFSTPDRPRFVAGSIGPTNRTASLSPDVQDPGYRAVTFDDLYQAYREQVSGLLDGGTDLLLVETIFDTLNAKAALIAVFDLLEERRDDLPVIASLTIVDKSGRNLSGQTLEAFLNSISHFNLFAVGLNCSLGPKELRPFLEALFAESPVPCRRISQCRASEPVSASYDETPESMSPWIGDFISRWICQSYRWLLRNHSGSYPGSSPALLAGAVPRAVPAPATRSPSQRA